ncbi:MAG: hypothetical protein HYV15_05320 [Elusimicrobia bacterium]|nr:hypothetical protein [Elusimicrobiota bacterium]
MTWPPSFSNEDQLALKLALNVSGSYEGPDGWSNLTDDFDGQGVSMGLLNQNLGQGSLQPMLVRMRDEHYPVLQNIFSPQHLLSLLQMLGQWQPPPSPPPADDKPNSTIDEPETGVTAQLSPAAAEGVAWAKKNLYQPDGSFDPGWAAELKALAAAPEFVSIQIAEAAGLHERALADETRTGIRELRAYLMFFDVAVQNGGFHAVDITEFTAWKRRNPKASTAQKLSKLLSLRLRHVRRRFVIDVNQRKQAIIFGKGRVHGELRNLPAQYCYDGTWAYK